MQFAKSVTGTLKHLGGGRNQVGNPRVPTIKQLEKQFGAPALKWAGKCYAVACAAAKLIDGSTPVYGHYLGSVHPKSMFASAARAGFVQHGWVILPDRSILDPTRWVFEVSYESIRRRKAVPRIYVGLPGNDYDEGGNQFRVSRLGPPPDFDFEEEEIINIRPSMLSSGAWTFVERILDLERYFMLDRYNPGDITMRQLHWVANLDPRTMEGHAREIYALLKTLKASGFVPCDNYQMAQREAL